jgi:RimJ/RimL family protein N-acetyltransferase
MTKEKQRTVITAIGKQNVLNQSNDKNMTDWIKHPTTLSGQTIDLISLEKTHFAELETLAKDKRIWEFYPFDGTNSENFINAFETALIERESGNQFPFVIVNKQNNKIIGSTRYLDIQPKHKKLEIGWTWLHPDYWATEVNLECKLLLLTNCFETLKAIRVQLKTDENNLRSRKAIQKIGGKFEGTLRNDMIRDNNTKRNSAYYSIIDEEWPGNKLKLTELYQVKKNT